MIKIQFRTMAAALIAAALAGCSGYGGPKKDAAPAEIDGERETGRSRTDDDNVTFQLVHRGSD